jgi:hypothetical protein
MEPIPAPLWWPAISGTPARDLPGEEGVEAAGTATRSISGFGFSDDDDAAWLDEVVAQRRGQPRAEPAPAGAPGWRRRALSAGGGALLLLGGVGAVGLGIGLVLAILLGPLVGLVFAVYDLARGGDHRVLDVSLLLLCVVVAVALSRPGGWRRAGRATGEVGRAGPRR